MGLGIYFFNLYNNNFIIKLKGDVLMRFFKDSRIKTQFLIVFFLLILISAISGIFSIWGTKRFVNEINISYQKNIFFLDSLNDLNISFATLRRLALSLSLATSTFSDSYSEELQILKEAIVDSNLTMYRFMEDVSSLDGNVSPEIAQKISMAYKISTSYEDEYIPTIQQIINLIEENKYLEAYAAVKNAASIGTDLSEDVYSILTQSVDSLTKNANRLNSLGNLMFIVITILTISSVIVSWIIAILFGNIFSKKITKLSLGAKEVANGNFNVKVSNNDRDEFGILSRDVEKVVDTIKNITEDIKHLNKEHGKGNISATLDKSKYSGEFGKMVFYINTLLKNAIDDMQLFLNFSEQLSQGDFDSEIPALPGEKQRINTVADTMKENLTAINKEIIEFAKSITKGVLLYRIDVSGFQGGWKEILESLNNLMRTVEEPINEIIPVLLEVEKGKFDKEITKKYEGSFGVITSALNDTAKTLKNYINEISNVLGKMSNDDFDVSLNGKYNGDFETIRDAINTIISRLNTVFKRFNDSSEQVFYGARQVAESSLSLAEGATEQANSVRILNDTINTISGKIKISSEKAKSVNELSEVSKENATTGDHAMKAMLESMERISDSSQDISKIIKVIDDIAFQTNLLALNAAVEAARAGVHGKGFAVVAEEVRNLAARSQKAAGETNALIENSINAVTEGTKLAGATDKALVEIVFSIEKMSDIIGEISDLSEEQAIAISQISEGIHQVSIVVTNNSASSEEEAASSEELSGQSEKLQSMISEFKLRAE